MNTQEIQKYLGMLGDELSQRQVTGEIVLVGGAVMLLSQLTPRTQLLIQSMFP
jgi:hypothetical protein